MVRHRSGRYYARAWANGKEVWKSLKTKRFSVAQAKLSEFLKDYWEKRKASEAFKNGKMTFTQALAIQREKIASNVRAKRTKPATEHSWNQVYTALLKSWPDLAARDIRRITSSDCEMWARGFAAKSSATRFNNTIAGLRHVFDVAVEAAIIYSNPASKLERLPVRPKHLSLPSTAKFEQLLDTIKNAGGWCSRDCADFVEGMAVSGVRLRDAGELEWRDLDFESNEILIRGDAAGTGTKNWTVYRVPMIPRAQTLFARMRAARPNDELTEKIFKVRDAQKAINSACRKLAIPRITHHDLRHLFATVCIESGVDIPTVSRWLNHKDGGALAMRTYGHLRREHSIAQAQRVSFAPVEASRTNMILFPATA